MVTIRTPNFRTPALAFALAASIVALSGCGGSSGGDTPKATGDVDTSGVTNQSLRSSATAGMTQGITSNTSAFTTVFSDSKALQQLSGQLSNRSGFGAGSGTTRALGDGLDSDTVTDQIDDALETVGELIDLSTITQNGNVYTFDPNENQICADPDDAESAAECVSLLSHITFVITVNNVVNDQVVAATTAFKYDQSTFVVVDFTANSGYYEIQLAGLRTLLVGLNSNATDDDLIDIPAVMQGSLRLAFTAVGNESGTVTLSVPATISLSDNTEGEELQIDIAQTDKLFSLAADGTAKTMSVEVSIGALNLLTSDDDEAGSFPVRLALSGITGKAMVTEAGDKLTLTNISANSVTVKVEDTQAASLSLTAFDAVLDASGTNAIATLSKALDFDLSITNLRNVFEDLFEGEGPGQTLTASIDAPSGTRVEEVGDDLLKVMGGSLNIVITPSDDDPVNVQIPDGSCLDTSEDAPTVTSCPSAS